MKSTIVLDMVTGDKNTYVMPPEKAVVCAFEQVERGNYQESTYDFSMAHKGSKKNTVRCGNQITTINEATWGTLKDGDKMSVNMIDAEEFKSGVEIGMTPLDKATKKEVSVLLENIITRCSNGWDLTSVELGRDLARVQSFFHVGAVNKKDPIEWCLTALSTAKSEKIGYKKLGKYIEGVGLVCTDSKRIHIYNGCLVEKPDDKNYFHPVTKKWISDEDAEALNCNGYPNIESFLERNGRNAVELDISDFATFDKSTVCANHTLDKVEFPAFKRQVDAPVSDYMKKIAATIPECCPDDGFQVKVFYEKKYFNQALNNMESPEFLFEYNCPLIITSSNNRKAIIMGKLFK